MYPDHAIYPGNLPQREIVPGLGRGGGSNGGQSSHAGGGMSSERTKGFHMAGSGYQGDLIRMLCSWVGKKRDQRGWRRTRSCELRLGVSH